MANKYISSLSANLFRTYSCLTIMCIWFLSLSAKLWHLLGSYSNSLKTSVKSFSYSTIKRVLAMQLTAIVYLVLVEQIYKKGSVGILNLNATLN